MNNIFCKFPLPKDKIIISNNNFKCINYYYHYFHLIARIVLSYFPLPIHNYDVSKINK